MSSGEDRISLLSDDLLHHIVSFVDPCTRFHARTSVLSKRWRHLWAHHPNLHLSLPEPPTEKSNKEIKSIRRSYVRSVHRCLKSFDPASLHSFTVCLFHFHYAAGHRWLRFAALKSVKDLTVLGRFATRRGRDGGFCLIPRSLFLCQDITHLAIHSGKLRNVPCSFQGFRGLKNLSFVRVHVSNKTLADLLDSCPLLECLTLDKCEGLTCLKIDSKNLACLFLDTTYTEMELSIEAPNLEAIHLEGDLIELDWKGSSVLLSEASLLVYALDEQWIRLACAVSNVSVLNANSCFFQGLFVPHEVALAMSNGEDRMSLLSDDLLHHILSFVDPCTRFNA